MGIVIQRHNISLVSSVFTQNHHLHLVRHHHCVMCTLSSSSFLIMFKDWSLWIPEWCDHDFTCSWLRYEFLFDKGCQMFLFSTLTFALWLIMVNPCFVNNNSVTYKGVTLLMIPLRALNSCPKGYACVVPSVVSEPILHRPFGIEVCDECDFQQTTGCHIPKDSTLHFNFR
jgi:hypothetical protein